MLLPRAVSTRSTVGSTSLLVWEHSEASSSRQHVVWIELSHILQFEDFQLPSGRFLIVDVVQLSQVLVAHLEAISQRYVCAANGGVLSNGDINASNGTGSGLENGWLNVEGASSLSRLDGGSSLTKSRFLKIFNWLVVSDASIVAICKGVFVRQYVLNLHIGVDGILPFEVPLVV